MRAKSLLGNRIGKENVERLKKNYRIKVIRDYSKTYDQYIGLNSYIPQYKISIFWIPLWEDINDGPVDYDRAVQLIEEVIEEEYWKEVNIRKEKSQKKNIIVKRERFLEYPFKEEIQW